MLTSVVIGKFVNRLSEMVYRGLCITARLHAAFAG